MKQKILITGANGLLGQKLVNLLAGDYQVIATARQKHLSIPVQQVEYIPLDLVQVSAVRDLIKSFAPDTIINCAAYTHVDACENNRELCWDANVRAVEHLAQAARQNMTMLIQLSTDYLFDGTAGPYSEDEMPKPVGYYGKSKLAAENVVRMTGIPYAIVRTNVIFGEGTNVKNNFFRWVYQSLTANKKIKVVTDQYNNPVLAEDLAEGIRRLIEGSKYGVYHLAGSEYLSRFEYALKLAEVFDLAPNLIYPVTTAELQQSALRPLRGGLKIEKAVRDFGYQPRSLYDAFSFLRTFV